MAKNTETIKKSLAHALKGPRITEKASLLSASDIYTFDVPKDFNKLEIADAIESIYKVKPVRVRIIAIPSKKVMHGGKPGIKKGGKKAMVYLKKGDKIEFV